MFLHLDCRHYRGDRPCLHHRPCEGCPHYAPMGPRVLIIKLGALGDVVRTGCLLPALAGWPEPPHVTWVTAPAAQPLVERLTVAGRPAVHRVLPFTTETLAHLELEHFDCVLSLDKEPGPCALAMRIEVRERLGIGLSRYGTVYPLNEECEYYFRLGLDNEEKFFRNRKSYPRLLFEALGWDYGGERYELTPTAADEAEADRRLRAAGLPADAPFLAVNPGAGGVFANKAWRTEGYMELIQRLRAERPELHFVLTGGPEDSARLDAIAAAVGPDRMHAPGADLPLGPFAALIGRAAVLVSGDTLAMHLAIAQRRRVVAIFGPTCPQEIELFALGERVVTSADCAPCYLRQCDKTTTCQDLISTAEVQAAVARQLEAAAAAAHAPVEQTGAREIS
ncbi:MAG TPA: glycosyltransferase family 9 protein [Candidatus Sumerlaeota bacterium]|nr:glycosyltransferase family 9 protein [Candidatus Sumerlaeota bacterium]